MIIADLETTQQTERSDLGTFEYSDLFYNLTYAGTKYKNYCLGYISKDNLPITMRANKCTFADGVATFEDNTADANFPCGYFYEHPSYSNGYGSAQQNGGNPPNFGENPFRFARLINQLYPEAVGEARGVGFRITAIMYSPGASPTYVTTLYESLSLNALQSWNFLKYPNTVFTHTFTGSTYGSFDYCANDFENNESNYFETTTGYFARVFITNVSFNNMYRYYNGSTYDIALPFFANVQFKNAIVYGNNVSVTNILVTNTAYPQYDQADNGFARYSNGTMDCGPNYARGLMPTGATGRINVDGLIANHSVPWVYDNDILAYYRYDWGHKVFFKCIRRPSDIMKQLSLFMRVLPNGGYNTSYNLGIYATDVTENDEFLARLKTGDIADPAYKNSLRPWQYEDLQSNDFDPDNDIPPYTPEPEPGGDTPGDEPQDLPHDDGDPPELQKDRYIGVPAMFITQYALTSAELQTVGSNLWQSWLTPNTDVHLNFFLPYAQDFGTLNIGAALDFIVSLKVFPFEFTVQYYTVANGVRMGTGHTDFLGSSAPVIHSQIICIDAGNVKVELPHPYNDFRDMYNCSALCLMPYCGSVELNLQEILGRTLKASYFIDLQSGGCTCVIECEGDEGDYVIASKTGQIGFTLPMTATNAGQLAAQTMSDAVKFVGTVSGTVFDIIGKAKDVAINIAGVNQASDNGMDFDYAQNKADYYNAKGDIGMYQSGVKGALGVANQAIDMLSRSAVEMPMLSGGGSAESFMFPDCVSIQIRRGKYKKPDNYPHSVGHYNLSSHPISYFKGAFTGIPATGSTTGKGLCMFTGIDTTGLDCRDDEREEIVQLLTSGVYL